MNPFPAMKTEIRGGFWGSRLKMNAEKAIYHQWEQLEKTGCIENFRLVADGAEGVREGWFFADSDAFKWLDAAARIYASNPSIKLKSLIDGFIELTSRAQTEDGYIYTYNQFFFPDVRWHNLQIEHELYCHGHLIEAGVSHFEATGERYLLEIAIKAADLIARDFTSAGPEGTPGHQEIEIAMLRLYNLTQNQSYLKLSENFIEQRGRIKPFITHIFQQNQSMEARGALVNQRVANYVAVHPDRTQFFQLAADNVINKPLWGTLRWYFNTVTGKYSQQHIPVRQQTVPVGHSVRFTYLETSIAMLYQHTKDETLLTTLQKAWDHMVMRRMYITGGIGSLPNIEGFGRDYELDPAYSYSETCAALGSILWNWEMTRITFEAKYADLTEWQLYNAAAVGLGQDGISYTYNNPLICQGDITRQEWFKCPCCPSNVSRIWADLGRFVYSVDDENFWVHQYVSNQFSSDLGLELKMNSGLPWNGEVEISLTPESSREFIVYLRIPSWSDGFRLWVNDEPNENPSDICHQSSIPSTASGYNPFDSFYLPLKRTWSQSDVIKIEFNLDIQNRATHSKVRSTRGQVTITRGPLVYCLERTDNSSIDIFNAVLDPSSLCDEYNPNLFGGTTIIHGKTVGGQPLVFIPYYLWANRDDSQMSVYVQI
jgi:DUF1680 family protein